MKETRAHGHPVSQIMEQIFAAVPSSQAPWPHGRGRRLHTYLLTRSSGKSNSLIQVAGEILLYSPPPRRQSPRKPHFSTCSNRRRVVGGGSTLLGSDTKFQAVRSGRHTPTAARTHKSGPVVQEAVSAEYRGSRSSP
jgi:hypothetical protein